MRFSLMLLAAAVLLMHFQWAGAPYSVTYQSQFIVPAGKTYHVENFTHANATAYAVFVGGIPYAILLPSPTSGKFEPETDLAKLLPLIESYYRSLGYSPEAASGLDNAHQKILGIRDTRKKGEAACRVLTGTDRSPCFDFLSCQRACYSVTSFCMPIALGSGRTFIHTISEFENATKALDSAYEDESSAYGAWKNGSTALSMWNYLHSIELVNKAATRASSSYLYNWYSYCFQPDYSLSALTLIELEAQKAYKSGSPFLSLAEYSKAAAEFSSQGVQLRLASEEAFNQSLEQNLTAIRGQAGTGGNATAPPEEAAPSGSQQQPDGQAAPGILLLAFGAVLALILAAALFLYMKRTRRKGLK